MNPNDKGLRSRTVSSIAVFCMLGLLGTACGDGLVAATMTQDPARDIQSAQTLKPVGAVCTSPDACASGLCGGGVCIEQTTLRTGYHYVGNGWRQYQLIRVTTSPDRHTYVQWFPPRARRGQAPVVVTPVPYEGINWTGDPIDAKWANRRGARWGYLWPDEDGPAFDPQSSSDIFYLLSSPKDSASSAGGFLINDVAVLQVFSRFYAGRTMQDYVEDVVAGLRMLDVSTRVKRDAIGIYGISLGGFQAVHGAARAPLSVTPVRGAAWAPPLDPLEFARYIQDFLPAQFDDPTDPKLAEYQEFFDPFVRRILPATGLQTTDTLAADLDTNFLLFHDAWDTLVPISMSEELVATSPTVEGFWFPHGSDIDRQTFALDHQQPAEPITATVVLTFSHTYLLTGLLAADATISVFYDRNELPAAMRHLRNQQLGGADVQWLVPRLAELADGRVVMVEFSGAVGQLPGYEVVGKLLNDLWSANLNKDHFDTEVPAYLQANGLPL